MSPPARLALPLSFSGQSSLATRPQSNPTKDDIRYHSPVKIGLLLCVPSNNIYYTPLVKALAKENGVNLSELANIAGTGAG